MSGSSMDNKKTADTYHQFLNTNDQYKLDTVIESIDSSNKKMSRSEIHSYDYMTTFPKLNNIYRSFLPNGLSFIKDKRTPNEDPDHVTKYLEKEDIQNSHFTPKQIGRFVYKCDAIKNLDEYGFTFDVLGTEWVVVDIGETQQSINNPMINQEFFLKKSTLHIYASQKSLKTMPTDHSFGLYSGSQHSMSKITREPLHDNKEYRLTVLCYGKVTPNNLFYSKSRAQNKPVEFTQKGNKLHTQWFTFDQLKSLNVNAHHAEGFNGYIQFTIEAKENNGSVSQSGNNYEFFITPFFGVSNKISMRTTGLLDSPTDKVNSANTLATSK